MTESPAVYAESGDSAVDSGTYRECLVGCVQVVSQAVEVALLCGDLFRAVVYG
jgi:hypothetical protein